MPNFTWLNSDLANGIASVGKNCAGKCKDLTN